MTFSEQYLNALGATLAGIDVERVARAIEWFQETRDAGRSIYVAGNGGSAATASHFVCDMIKGASLGRPARFRIQALHDNLATLTAYSNDIHYADALVEQLNNFARKGDLVMAISGSGNSANVVKVIERANEIGCRTIVLTGRDGGKLGPMAALNIQVAEPHMGRIEDAHHVICHMICYHFMETGE